MENIGARELKDRLAHYLRVVQRGEIVTVTVHRRPVARLVPIARPGETPLPEAIEKRVWELASEGVVNWSGMPARLPDSVVTNRSEVLLSHADLLATAVERFKNDSAPRHGPDGLAGPLSIS